MSIKIDGISKRYDTGLIALENVNLEISNHEFICILGPSGCGKSTFLNIVAGLDKPSNGKIIVDGTQISGPSDDRVMMFQEPSLFPWLTVVENIKFGLKLKNIPKSMQDDIALKYLKLIKLEGFKEYSVYQLSGGMQQRVTLARVLAMESPYILMDEPFSALDKQTINILREELELLWRQLKNTIIYVTHSVEEAIFFADRIVMFSANPGRIKQIFDIKLPRPRKIDDNEVVRLRSMLLKELRYEVELNEEKIIH